MENADKNSLFGQYKKRFKRKQRLWNILSIAYTFILIPLLKFLDGTDYSTVWRIISIVTTVLLIAMNFMVFDRIDPTKLDDVTYLRFQQKIINCYC